MEENRSTSSNDDQLRSETTNEMLRNVSGNPEADLSKLSKSGASSAGSDRSANAEELQGSDRTQGVSNNPNDMSATRSGGLTDMDDQTAGGAGLSAGERLGSGSNLTTKRNVTGSDFDGQEKTS